MLAEDVDTMAVTEEKRPEPRPVPIISDGDMMVMIYSEIQRKGIAGHHIDSMNEFVTKGIKQIITDIFTVESRMRNTRDKTEQDREISEISFKVKFTDVQLRTPQTTLFQSGLASQMTPNVARTRHLTYSNQLFVSAEVEATAYYLNGTVKTRTDRIDNHRIGSIPCMVGSQLCVTHKASRAFLKNIQEDPNSHGGYFIINGLEWAIDSLENISNNALHVYHNMHQNEVARGTYLSKPGDGFENSYYAVVRHLTSGAITLEITTGKNTKFDLPYYLVYKALGMTKDLDITNHIVYGINNTDPVTVFIMEALARAMEVDDPIFGPIQRETESEKILSFIADRIQAAHSPSGNIATARRDENVSKYIDGNLRSIVDRHIFPHIGTGIEHRMTKLRFLGHCINKMLRTEMGVFDSTDRDSYKNKRVNAAGIGLAKTFKTSFNYTVVQAVRKQLIRNFKATPFDQVQLAESVKNAIAADDLEKMLATSITTGEKVIVIKRNEVTNRISSQIIEHKNDMNLISTLNTITSPNKSAAKQNERADEMRRVHPTYLGFIDISQSADSGEKVGMNKQMASTVSICLSASSFVLRNILDNDEPRIMKLDKVSPEQITAERLTKVFLNGNWIACCRNSHEVAAHYRHYRRTGKIHHLTTIIWETLVRELYFWTDFGRLHRPLIIVYNNYAEYVEARRPTLTSRPSKEELSKKVLPKFKQWVLLTQDHINGLVRGTITMDYLREQGVIEYISADEQENTFICPNIRTLRHRANDITRMYTHCDIDQAIFGMVSLASPMGNHSNSVRNTLYTNHRRSSCGWFVLNWPYRIDKIVTLQYYCERPLVSAFSDSLTLPNGQNCIVALALHGGENTEDSIKANKSSIDCGLFNASHFHNESTDLERGEIFGNNDWLRTMDVKKDAIYSHIEGAYAKPGSVIKRGYVLIVKSAKLSKPIEPYLFVDKSIVYKKDEPMFVESVITPRNSEDALFAKVKLRAERPLSIGDKLSSRSGNKGIVAKMVPREDMPYCVDGMTPDLIVNAHSIPTRMAVNQLIEVGKAQVGVKRGCVLDGTAFRSIDIDGILSDQLRYGLRYGGARRMYNGMTGEYIDSHIFIGPTVYQRLRKFVIDEQYTMRTGPTSALTRQPLSGKNSEGGLRIGEMEKDVLTSHCVMRALSEKFYKDSDGIRLPVCRCGRRAIVNSKQNLYRCLHCGDAADIAMVPSSWVANLFMHEAANMNVEMRLGLQPYEFTTPAQPVNAQNTEPNNNNNP